MKRRRPALRRTPAEWAVRVAIALSATVLGYGAVARTYAFAQRTASPQLAHRMAANDARITALLAERTLGEAPDAQDRVRAGQLAGDALLRDPTAVSAVATLGLTRELSGDRVGARRSFAYAERLSRRDLRTQLWAIEDAVARGDVPATLDHYDIALRTSRLAPDLLFPVLVPAMADPIVRSALVRKLAVQPSWTQPFIEYAAANAPDPTAAAALFIAVARAGVPVSGSAHTSLLNALIAKEAFDRAWTYYRAIRQGADRRRSRDPRFTADIAYPSPFDWVPVNDGSVSTSIQRNGAGGIFDFAAPAGNGGTLLRQLQLLPAGRYTLEGHAIGVEQPAQTQPYFTLRCLDGRELGRVPVSASQAGGRFSGRIIVPEQCPVQYLSFIAGLSEQVAGTTGQLDYVALRPAG